MMISEPYTEEYFPLLKARKEKGFIPYLMAGYPNKNATPSLIKAAAKAGASAIELGVPFSDPIADGPILQKANQKALDGGVTLDDVLKMVHAVKHEVHVPILLMGYMNPFMQRGWKTLAKQSNEAGVSGFIIADLPLEETPEVAHILGDHELGLSPLCSSTTQKNRIKELGEICTAFIYLIAVKGVTGVRENLAADLKPFIQSVRKETAKPLYLGFGLSSIEQVREISPLVDGVIVGSRFAVFLEEHQNAFDLDQQFENFLRPWIEATHGQS